MQFETPREFMETPAESGSTVQPIRISLEAIAYVALLVFALVLRVAELDTTPLMASETHNALAAWREIMPNAPGAPLIATSPLLFALQSLSFSLFGASELTARLATVIAGVALVLSPLLFRSLLGSARAFLLSLLLAFSPVLLTASRASSPDVWALLLAALCLWGFWQAERSNRYAILSVSAFAALTFLVGVGGLVLALILLIAGGITAAWRRTMLVNDEDELPSGAWAALRTSFKLALPVAGLVVLAISTGFMLYPAGLSAVGEVVGGAVRAVIQPTGTGGYAALVSLFYEPGLWLFAIVSLIVRRERLTSLDIFLTAWAVLGIIASLIFADGSPDHALWLTLPLAGLAASALVRVFAPDDDIAFVAAPRWARWVIAASVIGILLVFTLSFHSLARSMLQAMEGAFSAVSPQPNSVVLLVMASMFMLIGFFLFASLWGNRTTWQGIGFGVAVFLMTTSLGSGWSASVTQAENPAELWHMQATHSDTTLLRTTLFEVSERLSRGFPAMPISVVAPQDGELAWLLRDYRNTQYVASAEDAYGEQVVILPETMLSADYDSAYVGQDFTISRYWDLATIYPVDIPALWTQRQARTPWTAADRVVLWLRADVYSGLDQTSGVG